MISKHDEIEIKLPADEISEEDFIKWAYSKKPYRFLEVSGPDYYYKQGDNVVRLRVPPKETPVLTVKQRKSNQSTRDRLEVDLAFDKETTADDIHKFLQLSGFTLDFILHKRALIFWFENKAESIDVSYYSVYVEKNGIINQNQKTYLEVEVLKETEVTADTGKKYLKKWLDDINNSFNVNLRPLNNSLWELFKEEKVV